MAGNKSLLNADFKNTIKMTLTTDGKLGVGTVNPLFHSKIQATGLIQGLSINPASLDGTPTGTGIQVSDGTRNDYVYVGLSTYSADVALLLGHTKNFGTNAGMIQVTSGNGFDGSITSTVPYRLALQPGGGNVAIHHAAPVYPLDVNGQIYSNSIVRADSDFTTGTNVSGWEYYSIPYGQVISRDGGGNWVNTNLSAAPNNTLLYKVIGKTVFLKFMLNNFQNNHFGSGCTGVAIILPPALQNVKNYIVPHNGSNWGEAPLAMYKRPSLNGIATVSVSKYASVSGVPAANNKWMLIMDEYIGDMFNSGSYVELLRGQYILELA